MAKQRPHLETAREAGLSRFSIVSILAGMVTAYGTFAILASIAGAIANAADADTEFRTNDWTGSGAVALLLSALVLLLAYLFGGYVAGRMARRSGLLHGIAVAVASLIVGGVVGGIVGAVADNDEVQDNLRSIGVPTNMDQVTEVAVTGVIVSLLAMLAGAALGGLLGERWHTKLARRVADDNYGPAAEARARAEREDEQHQRRVQQDDAVRRDLADGKDRDGRPDREDHDLGGDRHGGAVVPPRDLNQVDDDRTRERIDLREGDGSSQDQPRYTAEEWRQVERTQGR
ncbi:MAG TPA: YrzE family protein [Aquihabitans sp.]|jgi:membrane protease YdiL (CAAX protease family)|nr:YrzE family protein [Aquihabitans sp.]